MPEPIKAEVTQAPATVESTTQEEEKVVVVEEPVQILQNKEFLELIDKIKDRSYALGELFENAITLRVDKNVPRLTFVQWLCITNA